MKLIALKTTKFSLHPAWGPIINLVEDAEIDVDEVGAKRLIKKGLAKVAISDEFEDDLEGSDEDSDKVNDDETGDGEDDKDGENSGDEGSSEGSQSTPEGSEEDVDSLGESEVVPEESEVVLTTEETLLGLVKDVEDETEKKSLIQEWGVVNAGAKVSKSKSVDNMIAGIIAAIESAKEEPEETE